MRKCTLIFGGGPITMMYFQDHADTEANFALRSSFTVTCEPRIASFCFASRDRITASTTNAFVSRGLTQRYYKFLDTSDIDKVIDEGTLIVSSFEYFRDLEGGKWGTIADPLEAASELTAKGKFVVRENSPELEMVNKANIGLGMFQKFAHVSSGGVIDISDGC